MKTEQNDRRVRRTRQLLHEALLALISEQPYSSITVQDILDRADVGRSTFYTHFQDKDALFRYGFDRLLDMLGARLDAHQIDPDGLPSFPSLELFQHVQEHQHLYGALTQGQGVELLFKYGQKALSERIERHLESQVSAGGEVGVPLPVIAYYISGTLVTLLQWWLDNRIPYSPERMDAIFRLLVLPGVMGVLHSNHPGASYTIRQIQE